METNKYRDALTAEKSRLEAELATVSKPNPQNPGDWDTKVESRDDNRADENDNADALEDLVNDESVVRQLEGQLLEVNAALDRIEAGTYGVCEIGGEEIEAERLEANPAARTCKAHVNG
jgi:RNA polymerase-binding transcription factor DksA